MYKSNPKKWAKSIAADGAIIAALIAGIFYGVPHTLEVSVFFLWWISVLGTVFGLMILSFPVVVESMVENAKQELKDLHPDSDEAKEISAKLAKAQDTVRKIWPDKAVNKLAASTPFLVYHWISDIAIWVLLIIAGHPFLATAKVASFLISCLIIGTARKLYRERNGLPDPNGTSATVLQNNNVAGGDIAGGNIYK